jgi:23S rRNA G2445 N2-methylase RlmL
MQNESLNPQNQVFFLIIQPGLEELLQKELSEWLVLHFFPQPTILPPLLIVKGGLEVTLPWIVGREMTRALKLPTRVLLRLTQFSATDFPKFFQHIKKCPWHLWLSQTELELHVSTQRCRLNHTERLRKTFFDAFTDSQKERPLPAPPKSPVEQGVRLNQVSPLGLWLRGDHDRWSLSLDLCGEALYKRSPDPEKIFAKAPLRENLAQALLFQSFSVPFKTEEFPHFIWDPFCGSGTLLREFRQRPDLILRTWPWEKLPFNKGIHLKKNQLYPLSAYDAPSRKIHLFGSDIDEEIIQHHFDHSLSSDSDQDKSQTYFKGDFFQLTSPPLKNVPWWLLSNPPYGLRLKNPGGFPRKLLQKIVALKPDRCTLVYPADWGPPQNHFSNPETIKILASSKWRNGGRAVMSWTFSLA